MEDTDKKMMAAGSGVLVIMLLFSFIQTFRTAQNGKTLDEFLAVSMPRPLKEMILGFSLEGRTVIRDIEGNVIGDLNVKKADQKPKGSSTKAFADKGRKAKSPAAALAAQRKAQISEQRRKEFQARVIEQAERYRKSLNAQMVAAAYVEAEAEYYAKQTPKKSDPSNPTDEEDKDESEKMTSAEWRSLVLTQPSQENIQKMIKALPAGEIELDTYLEISETLIKDNSQEKRRMGIWSLTSVYRQEAFIMAAHLVPDTDAASQKLLNDYMYNYNRNQTLNILEQVLKSPDSVAAAAAAQSITKAIQNIQSTKTPGNTPPAATDRGGGRTAGQPPQAQQLTLSSYQRLIPTLKFVAEKNLNNLSQWAQNLLSQLQTIKTTA